MPTFNDHGIILNSYNLGEFDKILNIYTKENGLVKAVSKSARKSSSKFGGKVDQLSCCYFQFAQGRSLNTICDCEQVNSFPKLRSSLERLSSGLLVSEIVNNFASEDESDSEHIYELLYSTLDNLQTTNNPESLSIKFILEFLLIHGFKPQLETCVGCSQEVKSQDTFAYSSALGGVLCKNCSRIIDNKKISASVLEVLQASFDLPPKNPSSYRESLELLREHLDLRAKNRIKSFDLVMSL